jgi:para-nitrobenzyl esterase
MSSYIILYVISYLLGLGPFVAGAGSTLAPGILPATRLTNIYNGCTLSSFHGLIVGSLNYRLGALGFATFEDENGRAGNFGMKDQRQALKWFQSELTAFGGDPTKVTIFGESAGGESMFYHMASPLSKGLFHGAISESGFPAAHDWSYRQELTRSFASKLQCNITATLRECLRSKDVKDPAWTIASIGSISNPLLAADWGPVVDGIDMPETPAKIFYEGRSHAVPFMAGSNSDEANLIVWPLHELGMSESQYKKFVHEIASDYRSHNSAITLNARELEKVFAKYPATVKHKRAMASSLGTDLCFLCATHLTAQSHSSHADMFVYRFNHRSSCQLPELLELPGVYHGSEITYVFGDPEFGACVLTPEETALSLRMQVMWTNFAKHLNPMSPKEAFPKYTNSTRLSMVLQTPADAVEVSYRDDYCDLWQDVVYGKLFHAGSRTYDVMV